MFDELVRLNPNEAGFWLDRSDALFALGRPEDAMKSLRHSIELDSSMEVTHEVLAAALLKSGDLEGAEAEYTAALSVYDAEYKSGAATDSFHSFIRGLVGREAKNQSETALATDHLKLAQVLLAEKKFDAAISETQAAIKVDKNNIIAIYVRAEIYDAAGKHAEAITERQRAEAAVLQLVKGADAKEVGDPRVLFLTDMEDKPSNISLHSEMVAIVEPRIAKLTPMERILLATAYFNLARTAEAKNQWEKAIADNAKLDNAVNQANLGQQLLKANVPRDALPHLRRAYELDPQNTTYRMDYERTREALDSAAAKN